MFFILWNDTLWCSCSSLLWLTLPWLYSFVMCEVVFPKLSTQTACLLMHKGHVIEVILASFPVCLVVCVYGIKLLWNKHSNLPMATERAKHHYRDTENMYVHYNEHDLNSDHSTSSTHTDTLQILSLSRFFWGWLTENDSIISIN